jgi:UDP-3-O-[3-hydroxymyristoyl] glucosamine N-acyltransferase
MKSGTMLDECADPFPLDVVIVSPYEIERVYPNVTLLQCEEPKKAFFSIVERFFLNKAPCAIHHSATIESEKLGKALTVGAHSYIGPEVILGDNVTIEHNVTLQGPVEVGSGTIIHSGAALGADGFGFYRGKDKTATKIPHIGGIFVGQNVEIGANTCIDRGTLGDTVIEDNVKIDNLCHIGHNVIIGENSMIIANSLIGGSTVLESDVYVAPSVTIMNQLLVGSDSVLGMGSVVTKDVEPGKIMVGAPAKVLRDKTEELY